MGSYSEKRRFFVTEVRFLPCQCFAPMVQLGRGTGFKIPGFPVRIRVGVHTDIHLSSNGRTRGSDPLNLGSSPGK